MQLLPPAFRYLIYPILLIGLIPLISQGFSLFGEHNGFDLKNVLIPVEEIHHGGPAKDGIPAIDKPKFIRVQQAHFLKNNDRVLGILRHGIAKAYPISIMNWHEIVNDKFQGESIVISYCPLCGSGVAFSSHMTNTDDSTDNSFGVSGLLYNSDMLLYDRQTESLWSQILGKAISGPQSGKVLTRVAMAHTSWQDWQQQHPDTLVLSTDTGYQRDYSRSPYGNYSTNETIYFPVKNHNPQYHPKEQLIGLELHGKHKAYPFTELAQSKLPLLKDTIAGDTVYIEFNARHRTGRVLDSHKKEIPSIITYWFAWMAFYPQSEVYKKITKTKGQ